MFLDPVMWGYICSGKFTSLISYRNITSALFFTLVVTWVLAPLAFLLTLPVVKRLGWFWAEIPGHVRARWMGSPEWIWESGRGDRADNQALMQRGLPIRVFIFLPFILLVLIMVGVTATVSLRAAAIDSDRLASDLHQETSDNVRMQLDDFLARTPVARRCRQSWRTGRIAARSHRQRKWPCLHPGRGGQGDCVIGGRRR